MSACWTEYREDLEGEWAKIWYFIVYMYEILKNYKTLLKSFEHLLEIILIHMYVYEYLSLYYISISPYLSLCICLYISLPLSLYFHISTSLYLYIIYLYLHLFGDYLFCDYLFGLTLIILLWGSQLADQYYIIMCKRSWLHWKSYFYIYFCCWIIISKCSRMIQLKEKDYQDT